MIEGLKGAAALKELATLAQNLEKKLGLPVSVEVLQKLLETKDGYKYLVNIDGKLTEILSKKEMETGMKYWADGVKNQTSNTITLENLVQKPHILQSEVFKSDTLSKALGFEKLVEVVKGEMAKIVSAPQKTANVATTPTQPVTTQPEGNKNGVGTIRLTAAKETVLKELKAAVSASSPTITTQSAKDEPKATKSTPQENTQKSEAPKETQKEIGVQKASEKLSGETLRDKLREFKNIMASLPTVPSKREMERAKTESPPYQKEAKSTSQESMLEAAKTENIEKLLAVLAQNFEGVTKNLLEETAKKIADLIFGKLPETDSDEMILKILEHLEKQPEQKEAKEAVGKKASHAADDNADGVAAKSDNEEPSFEQTTSKTDNPASKLKTQLLEEMAKVVTKNDFQILSQVAMALNKEVFTFVLEDKGVLQFKKKGDKELNAKTLEFYSAFETLGPVSGEITHIDGSTSLTLNVEFESTYNFLKENLKELSFFDHKNVSIMHKIKEIMEIRSSFLDTTG